VANFSQWLIIELSESGETSDYNVIESAILNLFGSEVDYFIPAYHEKMGSYLSTFVLFKSYIFIKDSPHIRKCLHDIYDYRIFAGTLKSNGKIQTVGAHIVGSLKRKLQLGLKKKIKIGSRVKIMEGIFKGLEGDIMSVEEDGRQATVCIKRLSREMIAPIPVTSIMEVEPHSVEANEPLID
jgi:hypothetical protein